jgi:hypothetical protein
VQNGTLPYESLIAGQIAIVDPAELTAKELFRELARRKLFRQPDAVPWKDLYFMSVANPRCPQAKLLPDGALDRDYKYSREVSRLVWKTPFACRCSYRYCQRQAAS